MATTSNRVAEQDCYRALFDNAAVGLCYAAPGGRLLAVNDALADMLGYASPEDIVKSGPLAKESFDATDLEHLRQRVREHGEVRGFDVPMRRQDGRIIWVSITINTVGRDHIVTVIDVTTQRQHEDHTEFHDDLTDLPNQRYLDRWIDEHADTDSSPSVAILLVDVDHLSHTNNSFDRAAGDEILKSVADNIRGQVPEGAVLVRWAGDSFAVLVAGEIKRESVIGLAEEIVRASRHRRRIGAVDVYVSVSVGVAIGTGGRGPVRNLLRDADTALHQAKDRGRNRFQLFTGSMQHRLAARLKLEGELRRAVEAPGGITQFRLLFDPLVSLRERNTVGMEALVAWQHREHGLLRAADFVPLAEETGLISAIGHWVLREACHTIGHVNRSRDDPLVMSVNLSGHELNHPDIVTWVTKEIARADIDPTRLWLEITESALVSSASIRSTLWRLRDLGVRLVVDDFGTGYSSLMSIRELPVEVVKIDRSFVAGLGRRTKDETIVRKVVDLARSLDTLTVAEGVETEHQADMLTELGCELGQGHLFGAAPPGAGPKTNGGQPAPVGG